jgi:hypothetical protein
MNSRLYYRTTYGRWMSQTANFFQSHLIPTDRSVTDFVDSTEVVCQIEGSEGLHLALEGNQEWHTMSLLVSGTPLCSACVTALSGYGIVATDNAWTCGKKLGAIHPGLKPSRF